MQYSRFLEPNPHRTHRTLVHPPSAQHPPLHTYSSTPNTTHQHSFRPSRDPNKAMHRKPRSTQHLARSQSSQERQKPCVSWTWHACVRLDHVICRCHRPKGTTAICTRRRLHVLDFICCMFRNQIVSKCKSTKPILAAKTYIVKRPTTPRLSVRFGLSEAI